MAQGVLTSVSRLPVAQAVDPKSDGAARDWVAIYDECSRILYQVSPLAVPFTAREPSGSTMTLLDVAWCQPA